MATVTRDTIRQLLIGTEQRQSQVIGRALVRLYERQTAEEKATLAAHNQNGVGFSSTDAYAGTHGAKQYLQTNKLPKWVLNYWMVERNGAPRICKYHRQLNEVAEAALTAKETQK
jgi:hypothetical protein